MTLIEFTTRASTMCGFAWVASISCRVSSKATVAFRFESTPALPSRAHPADFPVSMVKSLEKRLPSLRVGACLLGSVIPRLIPWLIRQLSVRFLSEARAHHRAQQRRSRRASPGTALNAITNETASIDICVTKHRAVSSGTVAASTLASIERLSWKRVSREPTRFFRGVDRSHAKDTDAHRTLHT